MLETCVPPREASLGEVLVGGGTYALPGVHGDGLAMCTGPLLCPGIIRNESPIYSDMYKPYP